MVGETRRIGATARSWIVLLAATPLWWFGCGGAKPPREYQKIFGLPPRQQWIEIQKMPIEKQIDVYRYAMRRMPPDESYADIVASNGKSAIPILLKELHDEQGDYEKRNLFVVFLEMHRRYFDLNGEPGLLDKLEFEQQRISDRFWRNETKRFLDEIHGTPGLTRSWGRCNKLKSDFPRSSFSEVFSIVQSPVRGRTPSKPKDPAIRRSSLRQDLRELLMAQIRPFLLD